MFTSTKRWSLPAHPHRKAGVRPVLALAIGALLAGLAVAQVPVRGITEDGPVVREYPAHTDAERKKIKKNLSTGVTIPYWTRDVTSPIDGKTYPMSMVGSTPFRKNPQSITVRYLPIALKVNVQTDKGIVVQDPMKPGCQDTVPVVDRFMQSPMFVPVPFSVNGVDVTAGVGCSGQFATIFQRANFWGEVAKSNPAGNDWHLNLKSSVKAPIQEEITVSGTVREFACGDGVGTVGRVPMTEFKPKILEILKKYASPKQAIFILTYNVVQKKNDFTILGFHDAIPIGDDVQTYAVSGYYDAAAYSTGWRLADIESWVHEYIEWVNDPFAIVSPQPFPSSNRTPAWGAPHYCSDYLEPGDVIPGGNKDPYPITGANGYVYHFRDSAFYQWFYRLPTTAAGGKYSMMGTLTNYQENICQ